MVERLPATAVVVWALCLAACNTLTGADELSITKNRSAERAQTDTSTDPNQPTEPSSEDNGEPSGGSPVNTGPSQNADRDLVLYYPLDETDGTVVHDRSASLSDGVLTNGVWTTGKTGGAVRFDGTSTCIDVGTPASLTFTGAYTLAIWARIREWSNASSLGRHFISKTKNPAQSGMWFGTDAPADLDFKIGQSVELLAPVPRDKWIHLATTVSVERVEMYIDGVVVASKAAPPPIKDDSARVRVGCGDVADRFFSGDLDEIRVYKRALSATEIAALAR